MKKLILSEAEKRILHDRLQLDDCLNDVVQDTFDEGTYDPDHVSLICNLLHKEEYEKAFTEDKELATFLLADAVNGSTWLAATDNLIRFDGKPEIIRTTAIRTGERLASKVREFLHQYDPTVEVSFPTL